MATETGDTCGTGNVYGATLPSNSGQVIPVNTGLTVEQMLAELASRIEFTHLATSLRTRINIITDIENGFNTFKNETTTDTSYLAQELMSVKNALSGATAYINTMLDIQVTERSALITSVNQLVAYIDPKFAAAIEVLSTTQADINDGLFAERYIKFDLGGNVSGYGLSAAVDLAGNSNSDFRVAADTFSIAPPTFAATSPPPANQLFVGKVWQDLSTGVRHPKTNALIGTTRWWNGSNWQTAVVKAAQPFVYLSTPKTLADGTVFPPGLYVNNIFADKIKANQINATGLTITSSTGKVILGAGGIEWGAITGDLKAADKATVGAPAGTSVGGVLAETLVKTASDAATAAINATNFLTAIADDNILSADEKQDVIKEGLVIEGEQPKIVSSAVKFGVSTANLVSRFNTLYNYYQTLNLQNAVNTPIVRTTFITNFVNYYSEKQVVLDAIAVEASKRSTWVGVSGAGKPTDYADKTSLNTAAAITGQGALATQSAVRLGHNVTFPNGVVIESNDLVSKLSKINSDTIETFIDGLAITNTYIGNAAIDNAKIRDLSVSTLKIAGEAVTVPRGAAGWGAIPAVYVSMTEPGTIFVTVMLNALAQNGSPGDDINVACTCNGIAGPRVGVSMIDNYSGSATAIATFDVGIGWHLISGNNFWGPGGGRNRFIAATGIFAIGVKR